MKALGFDRPSRMLMTNRRQPGPLLARPLPGRRTARVNGHAGLAEGATLPFGTADLPAMLCGGPHDRPGSAAQRPPR